MKVAKDLGVPKKIAENLVVLAERSIQTGEYILPGFGRLASKGHGARRSKVVKFRVPKKPANATKAAAKR